MTFSVVIATLVFTIDAAGQTTKTRDQLVREDLSNFRAVDTWIYNDRPGDLRRRSRNGKAAARCISLYSLRGRAQLDQSIVERDDACKHSLDQYVCVRVVHANGLDLRLFQFDYDQSFAAFIMNGDKTIYGRYGTRSHHTRSDEDVSLEGFAEALEAGLELHAGYPGNKSALAGKQPQSQPIVATPEQFPSLTKYASQLNYEGNVVASCIHCHQVGESLHTVLRDEGKPIPHQIDVPLSASKDPGLDHDPRHRLDDRSRRARLSCGTRRIPGGR